MAHDDVTPPSNHRSGEWPVWAAVLEQQGNRIEKEMRSFRTDFNEHSQAFTKHVGTDEVLALRVTNLEKRQADADADQRSMGLGTKLAIIGAVASPITVILFEALKH